MTIKELRAYLATLPPEVDAHEVVFYDDSSGQRTPIHGAVYEGISPTDDIGLDPQALYVYA